MKSARLQIAVRAASTYIAEFTIALAILCNHAAGVEQAAKPAAANADDSTPRDATATEPPSPTSPPRSPELAMRSFELPAGFQVELVAAEPLVQDPVAVEWSADGKLWVTEMADYPYGLDGKMSPGGRVRFLEDTDDDGMPDRSTLFLDNINFPTGVLPWRNGVLVTAAPDILYAEDTDGDGKADLQKKLFTGFKEGNPQLRVNGLQWGLDGWVYCANGWSGGEVRCLLNGKTVDLKRYDFRIRPDTGELEVISGITEFGRNRDDWGNWFGCDNSNPAWHFVLEEKYLRRNPHAAPPDPRKQLLPTNPRVFARSQLQKRYHSFEHSDRYTSACAVTPYRDELLFAADAQHLFVCEPVHNLVQHLVLSTDGASFAATVPEHSNGRDFLTSTDPWFRPVNLRTGPDGALWVVDMYRYMIEHPDWLPDEGKRELAPHYRAGEERGRIYRVFHKDRPPRTWRELDKATIGQFCEALQSPNGWQRDVAEQQLAWRGEKDAASGVLDVLNTAKSAKSRLQALYTLSMLDALDDGVLHKALRDSHAMVRRAAVRLAEDRIHEDAVLAKIVRLARDDHAAVRLQVACTLGESNDARAGEALAKLLAGAGADGYLPAAVFSSLGGKNLAPTFRAAIERAKGSGEDRVKKGDERAGSAVELVALAAALGCDDLVMGMFAEMSPSSSGFSRWQVEATDRWLRALGRRKTSATPAAAITDETNLEAQREPSEMAERRIEEILTWSRLRAADTSADAELRSACLRLSLRNVHPRDTAIALAVTALGPQTPHQVQRVAVQELAAFNTVAAAAPLLDRWRSFGPSVRQEALSAVLARPTLTEQLLQRLEDGEIRPGEIDAASRQRLLSYRVDALRRRAKLLFGDSAGGDRQAVVNDFRNLDKLPGDAARGREVFVQKCAACHAFEGGGFAVGPELAALSDRSTQGLLVAILDPSRAIEPKYALYQAITRDGRSYTGILAAETSGQIELVEQENRRHALPRSEIEELASSEKSLMPEGFEKDLSRQQLTDLIGYLQKQPVAAPASQ